MFGQYWNMPHPHGHPHTYITQIILLESVQRDFTKRIIGCSNLMYHERLSLLNMQSLKHRRLIADLIMTYNIINKNNCLNVENFFTLNPNKNLRGHPIKISIPLSKLNARSHFLSNRIVSVWNSLPSSLVPLANHQFIQKQVEQNWSQQTLDIPQYLLILSLIILRLYFLHKLIIIVLLIICITL